MNTAEQIIQQIQTLSEEERNKVKHYFLDSEQEDDFVEIVPNVPSGN